MINRIVHYFRKGCHRCRIYAARATSVPSGYHPGEYQTSLQPIDSRQVLIERSQPMGWLSRKQIQSEVAGYLEDGWIETDPTGAPLTFAQKARRKRNTKSIEERLQDLANTTGSARYRITAAIRRICGEQGMPVPPEAKRLKIMRPSIGKKRHATTCQKRRAL